MVACSDMAAPLAVNSLPAPTTGVTRNSPVPRHISTSSPRFPFPYPLPPTIPPFPISPFASPPLLRSFPFLSFLPLFPTLSSTIHPYSRLVTATGPLRERYSSRSGARPPDSFLCNSQHKIGKSVKSFTHVHKTPVHALSWECCNKTC